MPMVGFGTLPRLLIAFDGKMMGTSEHADALAKLIGPNGGSLDEYIPPPVDSTQLTVDAVSGVTADLEEVVVLRYSMSLSRLALYDGPVTFRRFRTTPAGPELLRESGWETPRESPPAHFCPPHWALSGGQADSRPG